jgi:hypothetical protein
MTTIRRAVVQVTLALVMTGSMAVAAPGIAGATQSSGGHHLRHNSGLARHRSCTREQGRLAFQVRRQQQFTAHTAAFARLEAAATKAGNKDLAAYWAEVVTRRDTYSSHQQTKLEARQTHDAKARGLVNGKCT